MINLSDPLVPEQQAQPIDLSAPPVVEQTPLYTQEQAQARASIVSLARPVPDPENDMPKLMQEYTTQPASQRETTILTEVDNERRSQVVQAGERLLAEEPTIASLETIQHMHNTVTQRYDLRSVVAQYGLEKRAEDTVNPAEKQYSYSMGRVIDEAQNTLNDIEMINLASGRENIPGGPIEQFSNIIKAFMPANDTIQILDALNRVSGQGTLTDIALGSNLDRFAAMVEALPNEKRVALYKALNGWVQKNADFVPTKYLYGKDGLGKFLRNQIFADKMATGEVIGKDFNELFLNVATLLDLGGSAATAVRIGKGLKNLRRLERVSQPPISNPTVLSTVQAEAPSARLTALSTPVPAAPARAVQLANPNLADKMFTDSTGQLSAALGQDAASIPRILNVKPLGAALLDNVPPASRKSIEAAKYVKDEAIASVNKRGNFTDHELANMEDNIRAELENLETQGELHVDKTTISIDPKLQKADMVAMYGSPTGGFRTLAEAKNAAKNWDYGKMPAEYVDVVGIDPTNGRWRSISADALKSEDFNDTVGDFFIKVNRAYEYDPKYKLGYNTLNRSSGVLHGGLGNIANWPIIKNIASKGAQLIEEITKPQEAAFNKTGVVRRAKFAMNKPYYDLNYHQKMRVGTALQDGRDSGVVFTPEQLTARGLDKEEQAGYYSSRYLYDEIYFQRDKDVTAYLRSENARWIHYVDEATGNSYQGAGKEVRKLSGDVKHALDPITNKFVNETELDAMLETGEYRLYKTSIPHEDETTRTVAEFLVLPKKSATTELPEHTLPYTPGYIPEDKVGKAKIVVDMPYTVNGVTKMHSRAVGFYSDMLEANANKNKVVEIFKARGIDIGNIRAQPVAAESLAEKATLDVQRYGIWFRKKHNDLLGPNGGKVATEDPYDAMLRTIESSSLYDTHTNVMRTQIADYVKTFGGITDHKFQPPVSSFQNLRDPLYREANEYYNYLVHMGGAAAPNTIDSKLVQFLTGVEEAALAHAYDAGVVGPLSKITYKAAGATRRGVTQGSGITNKIMRSNFFFGVSGHVIKQFIQNTAAILPRYTAHPMRAMRASADAHILRKAMSVFENQELYKSSLPTMAYSLKMSVEDADAYIRGFINSGMLSSIETASTMGTSYSTTVAKSKIGGMAKTVAGLPQKVGFNEGEKRQLSFYFADNARELMDEGKSIKSQDTIDKIVARTRYQTGSQSKAMYPDVQGSLLKIPLQFTLYPVMQTARFFMKSPYEAADGRFLLALAAIGTYGLNVLPQELEDNIMHRFPDLPPAIRDLIKGGWPNMLVNTALHMAISDETYDPDINIAQTINQFQLAKTLENFWLIASGSGSRTWGDVMLGPTSGQISYYNNVMQAIHATIVDTDYTPTEKVTHSIIEGARIFSGADAAFRTYYSYKAGRMLSRNMLAPGVAANVYRELGSAFGFTNYAEQDAQRVYMLAEDQKKELDNMVKEAVKQTNLIQELHGNVMGKDGTEYNHVTGQQIKTMLESISAVLDPPEKVQFMKAYHRRLLKEDNPNSIKIQMTKALQGMSGFRAEEMKNIIKSQEKHKDWLFANPSFLSDLFGGDE